MEEMYNNNSKRVYGSDVLIFLILIPFISAFNYYLTYTNIKFNSFLLFRFSIDVLQGYLGWYAVRSFIFYLDTRWPYQQGKLKRIFVQLLCTVIIGLSVIASTTELLSILIKGEWAPLSFYTIDLFIISIWFLVINGIYFSLYFYNLWKMAEEKSLAGRALRQDGIIVKQGKQDLKLLYDSLDGFFVDEDYVVACHSSGKKYFINQSLDQLEETLPNLFFFRLNRQFILHRKTIDGFKRGENGKVHVMIKMHQYFPQEITVSRIKAPAFKTWFRPVS